MNEAEQRNEIAKKKIVYQLPEMETIYVHKDVPYQGNLNMDVYTPSAENTGAKRPAVVFVLGFSDPNFGAGFKETGAYTSWARLVAASGMIGVTYAYRDPVADVAALLQYLTNNAVSFGIDPDRIAIWSCSGNVPVALSLLMKNAPFALKCAVLCYGFMLDLRGATHTAQAAAQFGVANPSAGKEVSDLRADAPLLLVRAGLDQIPHLNEGLDTFIAEALYQNLPVSIMNHATGPHAFDLFDDSNASRRIIRGIVGFLRLHLLTVK